MTSLAPVARRLWQLFEPIHALVYFAEEKTERFAACGLKGGWMAYFASRSAVMGPVGAEVVIATFYNFAPSMVRRAIPDAWSYSDPEAVLVARLEVVDAALHRVFGPDVASEDVARSAGLLRVVAEACPLEGRPLGSAHAALPWPAPPHLALWNAATVLRESRGDGHVAALVTHGLDGCEANVMLTAEGLTPAATQASFRGWTPDEWDAAKARLQERGLLDREGAPTSWGRDLRGRIEDMTDALAALPFERLSADELRELDARLTRINNLLAERAPIPYPNPMGLPRPDEAVSIGD